MAITDLDLLRVAQPLSASTDEADRRSGISRAYYAAFHRAQAWHASLPMPGSNRGPDGGEHQQLINKLRNPDASLKPEVAKMSRTLGAKLEAYRNRRVTADYKLTSSIDPGEAATQYQQVSEILAQYR